MNDAMFYVLVLITVGMVVFAQHMGSSPALAGKNRRLMVYSAAGMIIFLLTEAAALRMDGHPGHQALHTAVIAVDILASEWVIPTKLAALSFDRAARAFGVFNAVFSAVVLALLPSGSVFYISREGVYMLGSLSWLLTLLTAVNISASVMLYIGLGRRLGSRSGVTLVLIAALEICSTVFGSITGVDAVTAVGMGMSFLLVFSYYEVLTEQKLYRELAASSERAKALSLQMVNALVSAVDAKDRYTNGHSRRVAAYSVLLAEKLGWDPERLEKLKYEALMHDVGKIGVPDSVLNKAGRLSDAEFGIIKSHTVFGADILAGMDGLPGAVEAARWHHERYDGRGYPDGKAGKDIPEAARIISVADSFDAMNSDRIYRRALPKDVIIRELEKGKGSQFDPDFADAFIGLYRSGATDAIAAEGRQDIRSVTEDPLADELRDFFALFPEVRDLRGGWDEDYEKTEKMRRYLTDIAAKNSADVEIALVSVRPGADVTMTDGERNAAMDVMEKSLTETVAGLIAAGRVSASQIAVVRRSVPGGPDLAQFLQFAFVYYYKIYQAEKLDVRFEILRPAENE